MEILAERLTDAMSTLGMSQCELSRKSGVRQQMISRYMRDKAEPTVLSLLYICTALNISSDYLLGLTDEMEVHKCSAG